MVSKSLVDVKAVDEELLYFVGTPKPNGFPMEGHEGNQLWSSGAMNGLIAICCPSGLADYNSFQCPFVRV